MHFLKLFHPLSPLPSPPSPPQPSTPAPLTPSTPSQVISHDWVAVECDDCSGLDKIPRHPPPAQKRTHSNPLLDTNVRNPRQVMAVAKEILTESCRSISDPDLTSSLDKERCSTSSGEVELEMSGSVVRDSSSSVSVVSRGGSSKVRPPYYNIRYSDNSLERSEVKKMLDSIAGMSDTVLLPGEQLLANGVVAGGGGKRKHGLSSKIKKSHKHIQKIKKTSKIFHSSDDLMDQISSSGHHGYSTGDKDKDGRRSSSGSPQEIHSPVPKKKNGTGIFNLSKKKKKHSIPLRPSPSPLEDPFGSSDTVGGTGGNYGSSENGHGLIFVNDMPGVHPLEGEESPKHHTVSLPLHHVETDRQQEVDAYFNLQTLVQPVNKSWTKSGYLWLRMKLPNGRYAWTHIVSLRG